MLRRTFLKSALASFAAVGLIGKINAEATKFLRHRTVRIDELRTAPSLRGNVPEDYTRKLAASVEKIGWCVPLQVKQNDDGSYLVLDGKIRTDACAYINDKHLLENIPVVVLTYEEWRRMQQDTIVMGRAL